MLKTPVKMSRSGEKGKEDTRCLRIQLKISGRVQGVGFRPFIYRLANQFELTGLTQNTGDGLLVEAEGTEEKLKRFLSQVKTTPPPFARIEQITLDTLAPIGSNSFAIIDTNSSGEICTEISPDLATCPQCRKEIRDPQNKRYQYPFTNCTNCGPRYSILTALPYDRKNTTMAAFDMCESCYEEYNNPHDRRFHAEPIACPKCGPQLTLSHTDGVEIATAEDALARAIQYFLSGHIVAVKGIGGFHLMCDARNEVAVARLRDAKKRPKKPFAVMFKDVDHVIEHCNLTEQDIDLLTSATAPIVLVQRKNLSVSENTPLPVADNVAPKNSNLGAFLAYTPLHVLLLEGCQRALVATSANRQGEPIVIDNAEAFEKIHNCADFILSHDRDIVRPLEDSVMCMAAKHRLTIRAGRGLAPLYFHHNGEDVDEELLALGGHYKNTIAICKLGKIVVGQHNGDLDTIQRRENFEGSIQDFAILNAIEPKTLVCDHHPDYYSTQWARNKHIPMITAPHHIAHVLAVMVEHGVRGPVLGFAWDGTGFGIDGTIWGGETFVIEDEAWKRIGCLRPFALPGGDAATREPYRVAAAMLSQIYPSDYVQNLIYPEHTKSDNAVQILLEMIKQGVNSPQTSSMGRLFDGVANILNLSREITFEAEAAIAMQQSAEKSQDTDQTYDLTWQPPVNDSPGELDWRPAIEALITDKEKQVSTNIIAKKFHNGLARAIEEITNTFDIKTICLSGGCFQNKLLLETTISILKVNGLRPIWSQSLPSNDGSLAVGQIDYARRVASNGFAERNISCA